MSTNNFLSEDILVQVLKYFQGIPGNYLRLINNANTCTDYEFNEMLKDAKFEIEQGGVRTDVKSLINLSMTNRYFNDLIKKSDYGRQIWVTYYNSLFPRELSEESVHIGPQTFSRCGNHLCAFPGIQNMNKLVDPKVERCNNPLHYVNNDNKSGYKWSMNMLFKKIVARNFVLQQNSTFNDFQKDRLKYLRRKRNLIENEIARLKKCERLTKIDLVELYKPWLTIKQIKSYYAKKASGQTSLKTSNYSINGPDSSEIIELDPNESGYDTDFSVE